jgi:hypothetical protein
MNNEIHPKMMWQGTQQRKRPRGRPRQKWEDAIKDVLKRKGMDMTQAKNCGKDRARWRDLCKRCTPFGGVLTFKFKLEFKEMWLIFVSLFFSNIFKIRRSDSNSVLLNSRKRKCLEPYSYCYTYTNRTLVLLGTHVIGFCSVCGRYLRNTK